ncbi:hypothetical protein ACQJBY_050495 [Aegilops geniculata]
MELLLPLRRAGGGGGGVVRHAGAAGLQRRVVQVLAAPAQAHGHAQEAAGEAAAAGGLRQRVPGAPAREAVPGRCCRGQRRRLQAGGAAGRRRPVPGAAAGVHPQPAAKQEEEPVDDGLPGLRRLKP